MAGEVDGSGGGGGPESGTSSPKSRVKFLCSHGGKILLRPADGQLKYVGGETRIVSLSHDISFSELMKKLSSLFDGDMVLKYKLMTEDLDALVSVKSDEDIKHMLDEYNRLENEGSPRLRTFLFPSKPIMIENQTAALEHHMLEQRYIDAINGIVRSWTKMQPQQPPQQQQQQMILAPNMIIGSSPMASLSISSACSSPKSASQEQQLVMADMSMAAHRITVSPPIQKVQSSPSICSSSFNIQPTYQSHVQGRHPYINNLQHHHANQSSFSARAHHRGIRTPPPLLSPGRLSPARSESGTGRSSLMGTTSTAYVQNHYNNHHHHHATSGNSSPRSISSHHRVSGGGGGGGYCRKCCYHDECPPYACNRAESLPRSPR